jgi:3-oxoacyl-[acyl-carrier protein] reductase
MQEILITGAGSGFGEGTALGLAQKGHNVIAAVQTWPQVTAMREKAGSLDLKTLKVEKLDLLDPYDVAHILKLKFDILVNNAGIGGFGGPLHQLPPGAWDQILNTNLRGVYYVVKAFAPLMIRARSGHIINISSLAGKNALPNGAAYAASKWGLNGLSYSVAEELRGYNIRVAVICPGSTNTELSPHAGKDPAKMLQPEDVAHAVAMLVTQSAQSFVSEILLRPTQKP